MMNYSLTQLEHFYWVSVYASFSKAAKLIHVSKAHISQSISQLETTLGHRLFHRTTRSVQLTSVGERLLPLVEQMMGLRGQIKSEIESLEDKPQGLIRFTCPNAFAECYLADSLPKFLKNFPDIRLEMLFSSKLLDLEKSQIDVAIRLTHEPPLDKVAKRLGTYQIGYYASELYLKKHGTPKSINELKDHATLVSTTVLQGDTWVFEAQQERQELHVNPYMKADNHHVILNALIKGLGVACLPSFLIEHAAKNKKLVPILKGAWIAPIPIYAIYRQSVKRPQKIDVFLSYLESLYTTST